MKYIYIGSPAFIPGLPMTDLDDSTLTDAQKVLLAQGIAYGLYKLDTPTPPPPSSKPPKDAPKSG